MSIKSSQYDPFIIWFHQQEIKSYLLRKLSQSSFFPSPPSLSCSFPSVYPILSKITLKLLNPFWVMFQSDRDCKGRKRHIGWQFSSKNTFLLRVCIGSVALIPRSSELWHPQLILWMNPGWFVIPWSPFFFKGVRRGTWQCSTVTFWCLIWLRSKAKVVVS